MPRQIIENEKKRRRMGCVFVCLLPFNCSVRWQTLFLASTLEMQWPMFIFNKWIEHFKIGEGRNDWISLHLNLSDSFVLLPSLSVSFIPGIVEDRIASNARGRNDTRLTRHYLIEWRSDETSRLGHHSFPMVLKNGMRRAAKLSADHFIDLHSDDKEKKRRGVTDGGQQTSNTNQVWVEGRQCRANGLTVFLFAAGSSVRWKAKAPHRQFTRQTKHSGTR